MNSAFGFLEAKPTPVPFLRTLRDRAGARHTAQTGVAMIVQRVVREVVFSQIVPDVLAGPGRKRVQFDDLVGLVPVDDAGEGPSEGLVATDACDPGAAVCQKSPQWLYLPQVTAQVGVPIPEILAKLLGLGLERKTRVNFLERNAQPRFELVAELQSFGKEQVGLQIEDGDVGPDLRGKVHKHNPGGAKAGRQDDILAIGGQPPAQNSTWMAALKTTRQRRQIGWLPTRFLKMRAENGGGSWLIEHCGFSSIGYTKRGRWSSGTELG